jgi:hypothetical protein
MLVSLVAKGITGKDADEALGVHISLSTRTLHRMTRVRHS